MSTKKRNKENPLKTTLSENIKKKWNFTDDIVGVEMKKPPICPMCSTEREKVRMVLRWTKNEVINKATNFDPIEVAFKVAYKCPMCAWVAYFFVPCDQIYWSKVLLFRKNIVLYYPPIEVWNQNDTVKLHLALLKYWGGRKDVELLLDKMRRTEQKQEKIKLLEAHLKKMRQKEEQNG